MTRTSTPVSTPALTPGLTGATTLPAIRIPLSAPAFTQADRDAVDEALRSGWVSTAAPSVKAFEAAFASFTQSPQAAATNAGTAALHLALKAVGVGSKENGGDEVIVPALSFIATVNPVRYLGATPVFADVERATFGLSRATVEPLITPKTKAIIATHLFGFAADVPDLRQLADERGLWLIEDAAEALGTTISSQNENKPVGSWGHLGCFSFNGNKTLTTGSGGMVVGQNPEHLRLIRSWSAQDRVLDTPEIEHASVGFNCRMNGLQAVLGSSQLNRLNELLACRKAIAQRYFEGLKETSGLNFCYLQQETQQSPTYWLSTLMVADEAHRLPLIMAARTQGIECRPVFKPLPYQPPYAAFNQNTYPNADWLWRHGVCLPSSATLTPAEQTEVVALLRSYFLQ